MIDWLRNFKEAPKTLFLNHGEPHQTDALRVKINFELGWEAKTPKMNESYTLS
jgi:metallo-beta-lactamase family protein